MKKNISVVIFDQNLKDEVGKQTNAAFVLGLTAGRLLPDDTFGHDVVDGDNVKHTYLTQIAHFVKKASPAKLQSLRKEFSEMEDTIVLDYTEAAAPSSYEEYEQILSNQKGDEITYRAIYVYGPEESVYPKTKNLSRL
jgi:hypothetical protein